MRAFYDCNWMVHFRRDIETPGARSDIEWLKSSQICMEKK